MARRPARDISMYFVFQEYKPRTVLCTEYQNDVRSGQYILCILMRQLWKRVVGPEAPFQSLKRRNKRVLFNRVSQLGSTMKLLGRHQDAVSVGIDVVSWLERNSCKLSDEQFLLPLWSWWTGPRQKSQLINQAAYLDYYTDFPGIPLDALLRVRIQSPRSDLHVFHDCRIPHTPVYYKSCPMVCYREGSQIVTDQCTS